MSRHSDLLEIEASPTLQEEEERWNREVREKLPYTREWVRSARRTTERNLLDSPECPFTSRKPLRPRNDRSGPASLKKWTERLTGRSPPPKQSSKPRPNLVAEFRPDCKLKVKAKGHPVTHALGAPTKSPETTEEPSQAPVQRPGPASTPTKLDVDLNMPWVLRPIADLGPKRVIFEVETEEVPMPPYDEEAWHIYEIQPPDVEETGLYRYRFPVPLDQYKTLCEKPKGEWRAFCRGGKAIITTMYGRPTEFRFLPKPLEERTKDHRPHQLFCNGCFPNYRPLGIFEESSDEETSPPKLCSAVILPSSSRSNQQPAPRNPPERADGKQKRARRK